MYRIIYAKDIVKFLRRLSQTQLSRIKSKIELVALDPFSANPNLTALRGFSNCYRLRVGNLRVVYEVEAKKNLIVVWKIDFRGSVYRH